MLPTATASSITQNADIRFLGKLLGDVIREHGGEALFRKDVGPLLLRRVRRLFFSVIRRRAKNRHKVATSPARRIMSRSPARTTMSATGRVLSSCRMRRILRSKRSSSLTPIWRVLIFHSIKTIFPAFQPNQHASLANNTNTSSIYYALSLYGF